MQKKIVRVISEAGYRDHTDPLFSNLSILKLSDIHKLELLKFVYNQLNTPTVITFERNSTIHSQNLRNQNLLRLPQPRSEATKRFVNYSGCIAWNNLPETFRSIDNSVTFKIKLKKYILDTRDCD